MPENRFFICLFPENTDKLIDFDAFGAYKSCVSCCLICPCRFGTVREAVFSKKGRIKSAKNTVLYAQSRVSRCFAMGIQSVLIFLSLFR